MTKKSLMQAGGKGAKKRWAIGVEQFPGLLEGDKESS